jgi:hypothetical protein
MKRGEGPFLELKRKSDCGYEFERLELRHAGPQTASTY